MKTLTVDDYRRVRLPDVKPRQVFAFELDANGTIHLLPVKADGDEPFPRGSLRKLITEESNRDLAGLARGSSLALP